MGVLNDGFLLSRRYLEFFLKKSFRKISLTSSNQCSAGGKAGRAISLGKLFG